MKVLFTTPILEHPAAGGPQLRIENSIKALSRVCELHLVSRADRATIGGGEAERFYQDLSESFSYAPSANRSAGNIYVRKLRSLANRAFERTWRIDSSYLLKEVDRIGVEVVWFGYGNISFPLMRIIRAARPKLKLVCDTDSVWSRFVLRELPYTVELKRRVKIEAQGRKKETEEQAWVEFCDVTTAVSAVDAEYYRAITTRPERIHIFSNVLDLENYSEIPAAPAGYKRPCIYLAGTFGHYYSAMDAAARWVIEEVLPLVKNAVPTIHFYIVGRGSDISLGGIADASITVTGKLPSVLPYLGHADVALVPLKFESGTRFKILEAAACGIPVVSTTLGAEGIPVTDGENILIADEPQVFADAIIRLVRSKSFAARIAENARRLVRDRYSLEQLQRESVSIFDCLRGKKT